MLAPFAVEPDQYGALCELFQQLEGSARMARFGRLVEWLAKYGVDIPYSEADLAYYTNCRADREQADSSARPAAGFYLDKAKDLEEASMKAYKETLEIDGVEYFTDLQSLLWQNYYDRGDNVGKLQTAKIAFDAQCDLVMN